MASDLGVLVLIAAPYIADDEEANNITLSTESIDAILPFKKVPFLTHNLGFSIIIQPKEISITGGHFGEKKYIPSILTDRTAKQKNVSHDQLNSVTQPTNSVLFRSLQD